jgi:hypothetical protein
LNDVDALVLSVIAEEALKNGHQFIDHNAVEARCEELGLSHDGYFESLLALGHEQLVDVEHRHPSVVVTLQITSYGLGRFFEATRPDLGTVRRRLIAELVNGTDRERTALAATLGEPPLLVEFLLDELDLEGCSQSGSTWVTRLRSSSKRFVWRITGPRSASTLRLDLGRFRMAPTSRWGT